MQLRTDADLHLKGWPTMIERAGQPAAQRPALRPVGQPIELQASTKARRILISVRDHGPGVDAEHLEPTGRAVLPRPRRVAQGHGLGLCCVALPSAMAAT